MLYKTLSAAAVARLSALCAPERVVTDPALLTDYGQPADEEQVWSIWKGNARVKR